MLLVEITIFIYNVDVAAGKKITLSEHLNSIPLVQLTRCARKVIIIFKVSRCYDKKIAIKALTGQGSVFVCVELIYFYNKSDYPKFTESVQRSSNA